MVVHKQPQHSIVKQCALVHVGPREYNHAMPQLVHTQTKFALAIASHGYILGAHMNEHTLLNDVKNHDA